MVLGATACGIFPDEGEGGGGIHGQGLDARDRDDPPAIDARPPTDARPTDARPPLDAGVDAPPVDAPPVDAPPPPAEPFTVTLSPPPVVPRFAIGTPLIVLAQVTNNLARPLNVDFAFAGGFSNSGRCVNITPHTTCTITGGVDISTLGVRTGTIALGGGGLRKTLPVTATVEAFVEAHVVLDQSPDPSHGSVSLSPAQSPGCVPSIGGCYPAGTQVTATAVPAPSFVFAGWDNPLCTTAPTCTVTAGLEPISLGARFAPSTVPVAVEITGGLGDVSVFDEGTGGGVCSASCTLTVNAGSLTAIMTTPGYILSVDGVATHTSGAVRRTYPTGTSTIAVTFGGEPGERELVADDAEFGPGNQLALRVGGTITVYDPAMVAQWSVPGDKMAFTPTGELYVQDGPAHTTKYASTGSVLLAADTPLGTVTPNGGMLVPGRPAPDQFSILDASLAVVATPTIHGQFGGELAGCLGQNGQVIWTSGHEPGLITSTFNVFTPAGEPTFEADRDWHDCRIHPTYHGDFVFASASIVEDDVRLGSFLVEDFTVFSELYAFDAAADGSDNLYWTLAPSDNIATPTLSLLRKYTPPSKTPVWQIARGPDIDGNGGIEPIKVVAAPDGRVAWVVRWYHPLLPATRAVLIIPASFTGPAVSRR